MTIEAMSALFKMAWVVVPLVIFLGILLWAYWPGNRATIEAQGLIPFRKDEGEER